ncbi:MAG: hypothetical protein R6X06_05560 [Gammaproteobacteria bacterium]
MTTETRIELHQKRPLGPVRHFALLRGRELEVVSSAGRKRQVYKVDLLALRSPSEREVRIAWRWWLSALGVLLLSVILAVALSYLQFTGNALLSLVVGCLIAAGLGYLAWHKGIRQQVFYSRHSGVPLVTLQLASPSRNEVAKFVTYLEAQIDRLKDEFGLTRDQELAGEMRTLRRLSNDGVISLDEYEQSKDVLFQKH